MRPAVREAWRRVNAPWEGRLPFMYLDVKGLVTTGVGNLVDPIALVLSLPWKTADGTPATRQQVIDEWHNIKSLQQYRLMGGGHYKRFATLFLDDADIDALVMTKLNENDKYLADRFPEWHDWCADAQMAVHSLSWAVGPFFRFPRLEIALKADDWRLAASEVRMDETGNPGLKPRNAANKHMLLNAALVAELALDPDVLYWPKVPTRESQPAPEPDQPIIHPDVPLGRPALDEDDE